MIALAAAADFLSIALGGGALVGGLGYAAGQFVSSRRRALGDSLNTALGEVTTYREKTDRLERDMKDMQAQLTELKEANRILRESISTGAHIAPAIEAAIASVRLELEAVARAEHEKTRAMIARQQ